MPDYTVKVSAKINDTTTETETVFVLGASNAANAERQARKVIEALIGREVRNQAALRALPNTLEARRFADTEINAESSEA